MTSTTILHLPADYEIWRQELDTWLDQIPGSRTELARHLVEKRQMTLQSARNRVNEISHGKREPGATLFLDIAAWLQQHQRTHAKTAA